MNKNFLLLSLFFLLGFSKANCQAQTPEWVWARSDSSNVAGGGEGYSIATDKSNNVYITGGYANIISFGSYILGTPANYASYLTKYDALGNVKWANSAVTGSGDISFGYNICTDEFGNVYMTGLFSDSTSFGSYTLLSAGGLDIFLAKYDSLGNVLWAKSAGGTWDDEGYEVSTDLSGNVYITGAYGSPTITFGSYTLTNTGSDNIFLAKYDPSGNVLWAKSAGSNGDDEAYSIATDALANVYITGYFSSPSITFGSYILTNAGGVDIFLTKYDSSGNVLWAKIAGGASNDIGNYIAIDPLGNAYLTGYYESLSIAFDSYTLNNFGIKDAFLAKYDSSGNVRWAKSIGESGNDYGYCVAADRSDRIYITGGFSSSSLTFDTITVQPPTSLYDPMFIAGYDSSGHALWAKVFVSGGDDQNAVASSRSGCIYVGGDYEGFNPFVLGNDSLYLSGQEDVFVAKLCYSQIGENVPEISPAKEFILYPNPFDGKLNVASPPNPLSKGEGEEEEFVLYDVTGRLLLRCLFTTSATINTEQLASGLYIYEIADKNGVGARGKVVKE